MLAELTAAQRAWRDEVRQFLTAAMTAGLQAELRSGAPEAAGPALTGFRQAVAARGWLGITWPAEFGGLGRTTVEQQILMDEFAYAGAPALDLTVASIAPVIMRFGTEANRRDWLPGIASGAVTFAIGYSEPEAGTDLASLRTAAVLDGDEWVISGVKAWNSQAHLASHEWLLVRTDPAAPQHQGLSIIVVPLAAPGIDVRPVPTWGGLLTHETSFAGVRVPRGNLIGEAGHGWDYAVGALDLERGVIATAGDLRRAVDDLREWAAGAGADELAWMRLAELEADVAVAQLFCLRSAQLLDAGLLPTVLATEGKIFCSELRQRISDLGLELLGPRGLLTSDERQAPLAGRMERMYRFAPVQRFAGGTNEVLRDIIAQRGHGMPRHRAGRGRS
jgi:3-oxocholest-4-en-26-oyl-CoA dehydrogenase alpha subunit